ncbi:hypothetical protein, partial [Aeromonas caviae]|uniref:hypothetical protein n=1 Tax=Aeromonas caviae TaxID=648 RepID=UPI003988CD38
FLLVMLHVAMLSIRHKRQKIVYLLFLPIDSLSCQIVIFSLKFPWSFCVNCHSASIAVVRGRGEVNRDTIRMSGVHMGEFLDEQCAS